MEKIEEKSYCEKVNREGEGIMKCKRCNAESEKLRSNGLCSKCFTLESIETHKPEDEGLLPEELRMPSNPGAVERAIQGYADDLSKRLKTNMGVK